MGKQSICNEADCSPYASTEGLMDCPILIDSDIAACCCCETFSLNSITRLEPTFQSFRLTAYQIYLSLTGSLTTSPNISLRTYGLK
jgi:hypothetical protein